MESIQVRSNTGAHLRQKQDRSLLAIVEQLQTLKQAPSGFSPVRSSSYPGSNEDSLATKRVLKNRLKRALYDTPSRKQTSKRADTSKNTGGSVRAPRKKAKAGTRSFRGEATVSTPKEDHHAELTPLDMLLIQCEKSCEDRSISNSTPIRGRSSKGASPVGVEEMTPQVSRKASSKGSRQDAHSKQHATDPLPSTSADTTPPKSTKDSAVSSNSDSISPSVQARVVSIKTKTSLKQRLLLRRERLEQRGAGATSTPATGAATLMTTPTGEGAKMSAPAVNLPTISSVVTLSPPNRIGSS